MCQNCEDRATGLPALDPFTANGVIAGHHLARVGVTADHIDPDDLSTTTTPRSTP